MPSEVNLESDQTKILLTLAKRTWGSTSPVELNNTVDCMIDAGTRVDRETLRYLRYIVKDGRKAWRGGNGRRIVDQLKAIADEMEATLEARDHAKHAAVAIVNEC